MDLKKAGVIVGVILIAISLVISIFTRDKKPIPGSENLTSTPLPTTSVEPELTLQVENKPTETPTPTPTPSQEPINTTKGVLLNGVPVFDYNIKGVNATITDRRVILEGSHVRYFITLKFSLFDREVNTDIEVLREDFIELEGLDGLLLGVGYRSYGSSFAFDVFSLKKD